MQDLFDHTRSTLQEIVDSQLERHSVRLFMKRDDRIDAHVSGNKWRKLKYNVLQCGHYKNVGILTFGGAYSNHLLATAAACAKANMKSVGVVRGEELTPESNETLKKCVDFGMHLHFVSRAEYQLKNERFYHEELLQEFPNYYVVPEGGANYWGMIGCQELIREISQPFDRMVLAQGTTTTSCGILLGLNPSQKLSAVPVLKGFDGKGEMKALFGKSGVDVETTEQLLHRTEIWDAYHFGGYAKYNEDLLGFIRSFYSNHGVRLDPIYTGKAMFALFDQLKTGKYDGESIVFLHTGGLQGVAGIEQKLGEKLF